MASNILSLPADVWVEHILLPLNAKDFGRLSTACRLFYHILGDTSCRFLWQREARLWNPGEKRFRFITDDAGWRRIFIRFHAREIDADTIVLFKRHGREWRRIFNKYVAKPLNAETAVEFMGEDSKWQALFAPYLSQASDGTDSLDKEQLSALKQKLKDEKFKDICNAEILSKVISHIDNVITRYNANIHNVDHPDSDSENTDVEEKVEPTADDKDKSAKEDLNFPHEMAMTHNREMREEQQSAIEVQDHDIKEIEFESFLKEKIDDSDDETESTDRIISKRRLQKWLFEYLCSYLALENNNPKILHYIGLCYEYGIGATRNMAQAFPFYESNKEMNSYLPSICRQSVYHTRRREISRTQHVTTKNKEIFKEIFKKTPLDEKKTAPNPIPHNPNFLFPKYVRASSPSPWKNREYFEAEAAEHVPSQSKDIEKAALHSAEIAIKGDDLMIPCDFGLMHLKGWGTKIVEANKAVVNFFKAANQGHALGQCLVGLCYEKGFGLIENQEKALFYYKTAAAQGNVLAQYSLGQILGEEEKIQWATSIETHVRQIKGCPSTKCGIWACCYAKALAVEMDGYDSLKYYQLFAENNHLLAQMIIGQCNITNARSDMQKPFLYDFELPKFRSTLFAGAWQIADAVQTQNPHAQYLMSNVCRFGHWGFEKNRIWAASLLSEAAQQVQGDACLRLGKFYRQVHNIPKAIEFFKKAAEKQVPGAKGCLKDLQKQIRSKERERQRAAEAAKKQ